MISEYPLGTPALGRNFPLRNRIISGLSRGVIVVEAALKSGSLITARQALEQGREVFAVPGSIHSPTSRGCHWLLREGAKLVENVEDILAELDPSLAVTDDQVVQQGEADLSGLPEADYDRVLAAIDYAPTSVDRIVERSGLTADAVCSMLLILELYNIVHITSGGQYCRGAGRIAPESSVNECGMM
jgi:DNA processing protein